MIKKTPRPSTKLETIPIGNENCKKWSQSQLREKLGSHWQRGLRKYGKSQQQSLLFGVGLLAQFECYHSLSLVGQPFDSVLLTLSSIYRKSRMNYLEAKSRFEPAFVSSPRTLGSAQLLEQRIEYSPIEREYLWAAVDPIQKKHPEHLLRLRTYISNVFHEQNHRNLWRIFPNPPEDSNEVLMYLNFIESLVITADMALADEISPPISNLFHLCGVIYDPGTEIKSILRKKRDYRNYLQAMTYATYLNLEGYSLIDIQKIITVLYPNLGELKDRVIRRSQQLDRQFVEKTNPIWQSKYKSIIRKKLYQPKKDTFLVSHDPMNNVQAYLWTEKWLDFIEV